MTAGHPRAPVRPGGRLPAELAVPIGMAIHELTTNAAKYGAFSTSRGWLEVEWNVQGLDGGRKLELWWSGNDGPQVEPPEFERVRIALDPAAADNAVPS